MRVYWIEEGPDGTLVEAKSAEVTVSFGTMVTVHHDDRLPNGLRQMPIGRGGVRTSADEALTRYIIRQLRAVEDATHCLRRAESLLESAGKLAEVPE